MVTNPRGGVDGVSIAIVNSNLQVQNGFFGPSIVDRNPLLIGEFRFASCTSLECFMDLLERERKGQGKIGIRKRHSGGNFTRGSAMQSILDFLV